MVFRLFRFVLCALCAGLALGCSEREDRVARAPAPNAPLVFLTHPNGSPLAHLDAQGKPAGEYVELAKRIAAELGRELKVEGVDFAEILPRIKHGTADFGIATISITEARLRDVDFSEPHAIGGARFLYRADGERPRLSQIASIRVGVEAGTREDLYLCHHDGDPVRFARVADAVEALKAGRLDAVFFDGEPLQHYAEQSGGRLVVSPFATRDRYGVAVSKQRKDVLEAANRVLRRLRAEKGEAAP